MSDELWFMAGGLSNRIQSFQSAHIPVWNNQVTVMYNHVPFEKQVGVLT